MKSGNGMNLRALLLMSGALMTIAPAFAQSAPELVSADPQGPTADETAAAPDDIGRDVIVVTALKRETDLQDTPISLSVVGIEAHRGQAHPEPARLRRRLGSGPARLDV